MSRKDFIREHRRLIKRLREKRAKELDEEADDQQKELDSYLKKNDTADK